MAQPQRKYSLAEYFSVEEMSPIKHEYFRGEIFAMAGASFEHNMIAGNLFAILKTALRRSGCNAFTSDMRITMPSGLYTYPDVSVVCGKVELRTGEPDTATNPVLIAEVLSPATRDYDRGEKFDLYRSIPTLTEYLLIEQKKVGIERRIRRGRSWTRQRIASLDSNLTLDSVDLIVPVRDIYEGVFS